MIEWFPESSVFTDQTVVYGQNLIIEYTALQQTYHTPGETRHCRRTKKNAHYIMHRNHTHTQSMINMDIFFNDLTSIIKKKFLHFLFYQL